MHGAFGQANRVHFHWGFPDPAAFDPAPNGKSRSATWNDVRTLAAYLADAGVDYALVGSYAITAHGFNRFSEDIDIPVEPSAENARRWIAALSRLPDHAASELAGEPERNWMWTV